MPKYNRHVTFESKNIEKIKYDDKFRRLCNYTFTVSIKKKKT